jgi:serine/threonine-protein kinase
MPDPAAGPEPKGAPPSAGEKAPPRIGGFEVLEKVGHGGMGAVYRARQVSLDRIVALKILPPKLEKDAEFMRRFLGEARATGKLSHQNIVSGIDVGQADGYW